MNVPRLATRLPPSPRLDETAPNQAKDAVPAAMTPARDAGPASGASGSDSFERASPAGLFAAQGALGNLESNGAQASVGELVGDAIGALLGGRPATTAGGYTLELADDAAAVTAPAGEELHRGGDSTGAPADPPLTAVETLVGSDQGAPTQAIRDSDALGDQTEEQQLKMQMVMDRIAKATEATANAEAKLSEASGSIVQNLK